VSDPAADRTLAAAGAADYDAAMTRSPHRSRILAGYLFALTAGILWGTTGPLSTALYAEGAVLTDVGFWRVCLATLGFLAYGLARPALFVIDRRGLILVLVLGGALVAVFEVAFQYAIAGVGVAGAATLLYTAPIMVAVLAWPLLGERLTAGRLVLAAVVLLGVALTVSGHGDPGSGATGLATRAMGIAGGILAAASFAGTTLMARYAVPRYGAVRVLFLELTGGTLILGLFLPISGHTPIPPGTLYGWIYVAALGIGAVLLANFAFFAGARRIEAAPTAVAASIEPVVGALLALALFGQSLTPLGWFGLALVVGGVSAGYLRETADAGVHEPIADELAPAAPRT
jgi:DME family drug/metabolite transporter